MAKTRKQRKKVSARRRLKEHKKGFKNTCYTVPDGAQFFSIKEEGIRRIDVLPYITTNNPFADEGDEHFERTYYRHANIGPNGEHYVCPARTYDKPCPICEARKAEYDKDDSDKDILSAYRSQERQLFNVIDLEDPEKGIQIWDVAFGNFGEQLDAECQNEDEDDNFSLFADLEDGSNLKLGITQKSFAGRNYSVVSSINFKARKTPYEEEILEKVNDFDNMLMCLTYEQLQAAMEGEPIEKEEDKAPAKGSKGKRGRPKKEEEEAPAEPAEPAEEAPFESSEEDNADAGDGVDEAESQDEDVKIVLGDYINHDKWGVCEVVGENEKTGTITIKDDDGKKHPRIKTESVTLFDDEDDDEIDASQEDEPEDDVDASDDPEGEADDDDDDEWDDDDGEWEEE